MLFRKMYTPSVIHMFTLPIFFLCTLISLPTFAQLPPQITNAPFQVVIPKGIEVIREDISAGANDASIIFRITAITSNAWFDAIAPYHPTAKGVYSDIQNRPESEQTDENRNIAILYASMKVLSAILPNRIDTWQSMLRDVGLDPLNDSLDPTSPIGIGNIAGNAIAAARVNDGFNQLGNEGGCRYNCVPYSDYTGYTPKNSAYRLRFPSKWQPDNRSSGNGLFNGQVFVTPQLAKTQAYTFNSPQQFLAPFPINSQVWNFKGYKKQADDVLTASAQLTDEQKLKSEFFDDKFISVFSAAASVVSRFELSLEQAVIIEFATNVASFDTAIAVWYNKIKFDAVRPFSAIAYLYKNQDVTSWGGVGQGTVYDMPAKQWQSYLPPANHAEYPSATASFCAAHAHVMRELHGENSLAFEVNYTTGTSTVEPSITPATDTTFGWSNWSDFDYDCGQSRLWAGVHFPDSIPAGQKIGRDIATRTLSLIEELLAGNNTN